MNLQPKSSEEYVKVNEYKKYEPVYNEAPSYGYAQKYKKSYDGLERKREATKTITQVSATPEGSSKQKWYFGVFWNSVSSPLVHSCI